MIHLKYSRVLPGLLSCCLLAGSVAGAEAAVSGVNIGDTRLIYEAGKKAVATDAINNESSPYLVQSWVEDLQGQHSGAFMVTPPLFRLDGGGNTRLRIVRTGELPADRETVSWLVIRFVPSEPSVKNASGSSLKISTRMRVKLFYRPVDLPGTPEKAAEGLRWSRQGHALVVTNPAAYAVSLAGVRINGARVSDGGLVPANETLRLPVKSVGTGGHLVYGVIDDFGGVKSYTASVQ